MRDHVVWKPYKMATQDFGIRTVYVRHIWVPFIGDMIDPDTFFSIPAFVRVKNKRVKGFITPQDGMAYQQEHGPSHFVTFKGEAK
jgi:hypothetical protein